MTARVSIAPGEPPRRTLATRILLSFAVTLVAFAVTVGFTGAVGTVADISSAGEDWPPTEPEDWSPGVPPTMSRDTTPEAGVRTTRTTPSASTCWQRVTRRA